MIQTFVNKLWDELQRNNPNKLLDKYHKFFADHRDMFKEHDLPPNTTYFRGRVGQKNLDVSFDDFDTDIQVSFNRNELSAVPPLFASGGRFNRAGYSYLYLSSNIKTCIAELRAEVGQVCSVGEFENIQMLKLLDLTYESEDENYIFFKQLMLLPVNSQNKNHYFMTQFMSDIIRDMGFNGILYNSSLSEGLNIVAFDSKQFQFVLYSDKLCKAKRIQYDIEYVEEGYSRYKRYQDNLNGYNQKVEEDKQQEIEYINKKADAMLLLSLREAIAQARESKGSKYEIYKEFEEKCKKSSIYFKTRINSIVAKYLIDNDDLDGSIKFYINSLRDVRKGIDPTTVFKMMLKDSPELKTNPDFCMQLIESKCNENYLFELILDFDYLEKKLY